ncbi:hypothetical protein AWB77_01497 [Caballeronia fortuita]|uniref:Uncharacterized protein n=1 Tax=Caballeronia fortuita TaxID=1777138 RepID=A0A158A8B6_9BURK|nr:hypothetical protein AWB77_01497 [Caballeronia fortuita]
MFNFVEQNRAVLPLAESSRTPFDCKLELPDQFSLHDFSQVLDFFGRCMAPCPVAYPHIAHSNYVGHHPAPHRFSGGFSSGQKKGRRNKDLRGSEQVCLQGLRQVDGTGTGLFAQKPDNSFVCTGTGFVCEQPDRNAQLASCFTRHQFCLSPQPAHRPHALPPTPRQTASRAAETPSTKRIYWLTRSSVPASSVATLRLQFP